MVDLEAIQRDAEARTGFRVADLEPAADMRFHGRLATDYAVAGGKVVVLYEHFGVLNETVGEQADDRVLLDASIDAAAKRLQGRIRILNAHREVQ